MINEFFSYKDVNQTRDEKQFKLYYLNNYFQNHNNINLENFILLKNKLNKIKGFDDIVLLNKENTNNISSIKEKEFNNCINSNSLRIKKVKVKNLECEEEKYFNLKKNEEVNPSDNKTSSRGLNNKRLNLFVEGELIKENKINFQFINSENDMKNLTFKSKIDKTKSIIKNDNYNNFILEDVVQKENCENSNERKQYFSKENSDNEKIFLKEISHKENFLKEAMKNLNEKDFVKNSIGNPKKGPTIYEKGNQKEE